jgi:hypothetical protein
MLTCDHLERFGATEPPVPGKGEEETIVFVDRLLANQVTAASGGYLDVFACKVLRVLISLRGGRLPGWTFDS